MKRKLLSLLLVVVLVMTMSVTAFAGTQQTDLTYNGEVYTVYARCNLTNAAANIRTTYTGTKVSVSCVSYDNVGSTIRMVDDGTSEANVNFSPAGNRTFEYIVARFFVSGNSLTAITENAP